MSMVKLPVPPSSGGETDRSKKKRPEVRECIVITSVPPLAKALGKFRSEKKGVAMS